MSSYKMAQCSCACNGEVLIICRKGKIQAFEVQSGKMIHQGAVEERFKERALYYDYLTGNFYAFKHADRELDSEW